LWTGLLVAIPPARLPQVTDAHDRQTLSTLLGAFYAPPILAPNAPLCPGSTYAVPHAGEHKVRPARCSSPQSHNSRHDLSRL
jgi:hypothetical protein